VGVAKLYPPYITYLMKGKGKRGERKRESENVKESLGRNLLIFVQSSLETNDLRTRFA
jgi:hypothetical protein